MIPVRFLVALFAAVTLAPANAQTDRHQQESLLREAIELLSTRPLGHERVDWKAVEQELLESLRKDDSDHAAHSAISKAVAKLNDPHARFSPPPPPVPTTAAPAATPETPAKSVAVPTRPAVPTQPEGQVLEGHIGYLVVPGCKAPDVEGLRQYATAAAAELVRLNAAQPKAWIIDLRLNGGGNIWPMLLGLHPLLGDGPQMTMVKGGKIQSRFGVSDRAAWIQWEGKPDRETQLDWGPTPPTTIRPFTGRIAILLGPWTMSSGESLAICFAGRDNTRTFGEKTSGFTTVNNDFRLSDGSTLTLPVSRMGDRRGNEFNGPLVPQQPTPFGDWPEPADAATRAAIEWLLK